MNKSRIISLQLVLLATGATAWIWQSKSLHEDGQLDHIPNVMHLKRSPFGRTLALAMRGPVDVYWHRGAVHDHGEGGAHDHHEHGLECTHGPETAHGPECTHGPEDLDHGHDHEHELEASGEALVANLDELQQNSHEESTTTPAPQGVTGVRAFLLDRIDFMRKSYYTRTNTNTDSKFHKAYIMGETQKRLAVSYEMDPSNLSGYGAYFLFLSEALARVEGRKGEDGVITVRRQAAHSLANATLKYCLELQDEAPAMITAATAAHDCLQIVLENPEPDRKLASEYLRLLDGALQKYESIRGKMIDEGTWELFPLSRRAEMESAHSLVRVLRNVDHELFGKLSKNNTPSHDPPSS